MSHQSPFQFWPDCEPLEREAAEVRALEGAIVGMALGLVIAIILAVTGVI